MKMLIYCLRRTSSCYSHVQMIYLNSFKSVCSSCVFIFQGLSVLQKVLDTAAERNWQVTSVNVETMTEASFLKVFQDLDKRKEGQIIIDCETERLTGILKKVKKIYPVYFW